MSEIALTFTPDGTGHTLYTETINLADIGPLEIRRATTIEFDNTTQYWRVRNPTGFPLYSSPSRQQCLEWERRYLESKEDQKHELQHGPGAVAIGVRSGEPQDRFAG